MISMLLSLILLITAQYAHSQPYSHQSWQTAIISSDTISIACANLRLPFEQGQLLAEPSPTTSRGDMDYALRSSFPVKIKLQPQTGTSDTLTTISGCNVDGAMVILTMADTGDTVTVAHTVGSIEFADGNNVVLDDVRKLLVLHRKNGIWVSQGNFGGAGTVGKVWSDLDGASNAAKFMDANNDGWRIFTDATGPKMLCTLDIGGTEESCNDVRLIGTGKSFAIDLGIDGTNDLEIASTGATTLRGNLREWRTMWVTPSRMQVGNTGNLCYYEVKTMGEAKEEVISCGDDNNASIYMTIPTDQAWDNTTSSIYLVLRWVQETASATGVYRMDWSTYCRGHSEGMFGSESGNYGTEVTMSFTVPGTQYNQFFTTVGPIIPGGVTCEKNDVIRIRGQVDATATTTASPFGMKLILAGVRMRHDSWTDQ